MLNRNEDINNIIHAVSDILLFFKEREKINLKKG